MISLKNRGFQVTVHIEKIELSNYRSCKRTAIKLNLNLSVLIGVNGSGKSNILNGILLLKKLAHASLAQSDEESFRSSCKLRAWFNLDAKILKYKSHIQYATNERNIDEDVSATDQWNFQDILGLDRWLPLPLAAMGAMELPTKSNRSKLPRHERELRLAPIRWKRLGLFRRLEIWIM